MLQLEFLASRWGGSCIKSNRGTPYMFGGGSQKVLLNKWPLRARLLFTRGLHCDGEVFGKFTFCYFLKKMAGRCGEREERTKDTEKVVCLWFRVFGDSLHYSTLQPLSCKRVWLYPIISGRRCGNIAVRRGFMRTSFSEIRPFPLELWRTAPAWGPKLPEKSK